MENSVSPLIFSSPHGMTLCGGGLVSEASYPTPKRQGYQPVDFCSQCGICQCFLEHVSVDYTD